MHHLLKSLLTLVVGDLHLGTAAVEGAQDTAGENPGCQEGGDQGGGRRHHAPIQDE